MQKNKNNNKNQAGSSVEKVPADALEAAELHIHNKDNSLVLRPLNRNLVLEYFKETLISRTICQGDTIHLQLHGLKHAFEV
jgi:virulence-associated protein VagC